MRLIKAFLSTCVQSYVDIADTFKRCEEQYALFEKLFGETMKTPTKVTCPNCERNFKATLHTSKTSSHIWGVCPECGEEYLDEK